MVDPTGKSVSKSEVVLLAIALAIIMSPAIWFFANFPYRAQQVDTVDEWFTYMTDLVWPISAEVVFHHSNTLVFDVDREVAEQWIAGPPPWEAPEWQRGVPPRLPLFRIHFSGLSVGEGGEVLETTGRFTFDSPSTQFFKELEQSKDVWFAIKTYPDPNDGTLLGIDPKRGRVWLYHWTL